MSRAWLALSALVACSGDTKTTSVEKVAPASVELTAVDVARLTQCVETLESLGYSSEPNRAGAVASACIHDCDASNPASCGHVKGSGSAPRFLVDRAAAWINGVRQRSTGEHASLLARLDTATKDLVIPLPLERSKFATAPLSQTSEEIENSVYLHVTTDTLFVGATPAVRITAAGLVEADRNEASKNRVAPVQVRSAMNELDDIIAAEVRAKPEPNELGEDEGDDSGGTGTKMSLDEGKMGTKESTRQSGQYAIKRGPVSPAEARKKQLEAARRAGILGAIARRVNPLIIAEDRLPLTRLGSVVQLVGSGQLAIANGDIIAAHAVAVDSDSYQSDLAIELKDDRMLLSRTSGEHELADVGGSRDWDRLSPHINPDMRIAVSVNDTTTVADLVELLDFLATNKVRGIALSGAKSILPQVSIGTASATGDLDKNIIRRYVRRKLRNFRICYEKELLVEPTLEGTVTTTFVIDKDGKSTQVNSTGVNPAVATCVSGVFQSIQFPSPRSGGVVNVTYPLRFLPTTE